MPAVSGSTMTSTKLNCPCRGGNVNQTLRSLASHALPSTEGVWFARVRPLHSVPYLDRAKGVFSLRVVVDYGDVVVANVQLLVGAVGVGGEGGKESGHVEYH